MFIYKIMTHEEWRQFQETMVFNGASIDRQDGYIHFSTKEQVEETANKHFSGQKGLVLVAVIEDALGEALKYEVSRGGQLFPHLYAPLTMNAVKASTSFEAASDNLFYFPEGFCIMSRTLMSVGHILPPEAAHRAAIYGLKLGFFKSHAPKHRLLKQTLLGLTFDNPLGVAAGFDKDAEVPIELLDAGFGFTEVGTITPKPQPGNDRPRIFRLKQHQALINRFGFNSKGHKAAFDRH